MRIPILHLIIGALVLVAVFVARGKIKTIEADAQLKALRQRHALIDTYAKSTVNIKDARWATQRGWRFLQAGDAERAVHVLERANELDANYRDAAVYLGYARLEMVKDGSRNKDEHKRNLTSKEKWEEVKKAKEILLIAQKLDPLFPLTNQLLGIACEQLGDDKAALAWYSRFKEVSARD